MAERLQGTFYGQDGTQYRVTLFVDGYSGSVDDFDLRQLNIKYNGSPDDIHHPVLASSATITFSVPNSTIKSVFTGLVGAAEEEYRIKIEKGSGNDLFWCGFVIPDQVEMQDSVYPYDFTITAVDGIGRLKDKDYTGTGSNWEGETTMLQHLYNVLSFVPVDDFWGASDTYLEARNQIFDDQHSEGETVSPLPITRVNHRVFVNVDRRGRVKRKSAYEVLVQVCRAFASRFYLSDGYYRFEQITEYNNQTSIITMKRWDKTASSLADNALNDWGARLLSVDRSDLRLAGSADLTVASGTINTWLSSLSKVEIDYNHFAYRSLLSHITPPPTWTQSSAVELNTGNVDDNSGASRILVTADVTFNISFALPANVEPGRLKMRCLLKLEGASTYYCRRLATVDMGVEHYQDAEWTTSISYVEFYTDTHIGNGENYLYRFQFYTPNLPDSGDLSIDFDFVELAGAGGIISIGAGYTSNWTISNAYAELFSDGTVDAQIVGTTFSSTNSNDTNSDVLRLETIIGDGPTGTAFGRLQVYTGSAWEDGDDWKLRGETDLLPHTARIAREIIIPRLKPAERIEGPIIGPFMAHTIIERSTTRYIFMQGTIDLNRGITNGTWVYITDTATLSITPEAGVDFEEIDDEEPTGPSVPWVPPPTWSGETVDPSVSRITIDNGVVYTTTTGLETTDTGTTFITVSERDHIHNFYDGDIIDLIHPYSGQAQRLTLNVSQESDKTITVDSFDPDIDFPKSSFVAPSTNWMFRMLSKLRHITHTVLLVDSFLEIPATATTMPFQVAAFFRVPTWMDNYLLKGWTASWATVGTGSGYLNVRVTADGVSNDLTFNFTNTQETKTLSTYQTLSTGDLITFNFSNMSDASSTRPKGLTVDLELIARL